MQMFTGRVRDGVIPLEGDVTLPEGTTVTVIAGDAGQPFDLTEEDEAELEQSIREVEAGHVITAAELLERLRR
jgi:hypothetical protein